MNADDKDKNELFSLLIVEEGLTISTSRIVKKKQLNDMFPLSFVQQRLWFLNQLVPDSPFYNVPMVLRLACPLYIVALQQALREILSRHEALRTVFVLETSQPVQHILPLAQLPSSLLNLFDLRLLSEGQREREAQRLINEEASHPFDLSNEISFRTKLLQLGTHEHILLLTLHHIACDGWSLGILHDELSALYNAFSHGESSSLPPLPIQYADFAVWQRQWLQGNDLASHLDYWRQQLAGLPQLELAYDFERPVVETFRGGRQHILLPLGLVQRIKVLSQQNGVTLFMTLLTAFMMLLSRYSGQMDLAVGTPIANRTRRELEEIIGFFVNTLVLRCNLIGDQTFLQVLQQVREMGCGALAERYVQS